MDIQEIREEIKKLEDSETTYQNCSKLSVLYSVVDHLDKTKTKEVAYSYGSSEFLLAVSRAPIEEVMKIVDEHMDAIQLLYPKEYAAVVKKIKELSPLK